MKQTKRNIAIVCGGYSQEYDVSMASAEGLYSFFDKQKYNVRIVIVTKTDWKVVGDSGETVSIDKNNFTFCEAGEVKTFDYAYITIHGTPGEDGLMQGYFDLIGIPYSTSGVLVEAITFDKYVLNNYLRGFGIRVADNMLLRPNDINEHTVEEIKQRIGLPCFIKPTADGSSFGVSKVKNDADIMPALQSAFNENAAVMVERYMAGTEISIGCYKTKAGATVLPATEVVTENEFFDYNAKYKGEVQEITPARISPDTAALVAEQTSRIYDLLHCNGIIRIDYIITRNERGEDVINMLEVNTTPGMTTTSFIPQQVKAAGLNITEVLTEIVENQFS